MHSMTCNIHWCGIHMYYAQKECLVARLLLRWPLVLLAPAWGHHFYTLNRIEHTLKAAVIGSASYHRLLRTCYGRGSTRSREGVFWGGGASWLCQPCVCWRAHTYCWTHTMWLLQRVNHAGISPHSATPVQSAVALAQTLLLQQGGGFLPTGHTHLL